ncbi:Cathepsin E [Manis javanica]|nr:Cathepsin E [Manis javanica]
MLNKRGNAQRKQAGKDSRMRRSVQFTNKDLGISDKQQNSFQSPFSAVLLALAIPMFSVLLPSTAEESSNDSLSIGGQQVQQTNANLHFLHFTQSLHGTYCNKMEIDFTKFGNTAVFCNLCNQAYLKGWV